MKHAFLVIAHNEPIILECLLRQLNHPDNTIFVHIDKKVKGDLESRMFAIVNNLGGVIVKKRIDVRWGDFSQICCELALYEEASRIGFDYYHLVSGCDLALKPMHVIHRFFTCHAGKEFIKYDNDIRNRQDAYNKINYYYFFMRCCTKRTTGKSSWLLKTLKIPQISLKLQNLFNISRCEKDDMIIYKGGNWCSLTHDAVIYILSQKDKIRKRFKWTRCADEIYKHTILKASLFANQIYQPLGNNQSSDLRMIDWKRGNPYIWTIYDKRELLGTDNLFARKFSSKDLEIVESIMQCTQ